MLARASVVGALAYLAPRLGRCRAAARRSVHAALVSLAILLGSARDPMAAERILREGAPVYAAVARRRASFSCAGVAAASALGVESPAVAGALATLALVALAVRLALLLHPQFYYPDVKVHGAVRLGAGPARARGLPPRLHGQPVPVQPRAADGERPLVRVPLPAALLRACAGPWCRWPATGRRPRSRWWRRPSTASRSLVVFGIARALKAAAAAGLLAAAAAHPLLPIFIARLTLAYFPALVGHAVDAVVILYLTSRLGRLDRRGVVLRLAGLMGLAFLTYTQSLLNFAVLVGLFVVLPARL